MANTASSEQINQMVESMNNGIILGILEAIKIIWLKFWPYIIIFILIVIAGVIIQIIRIKKDRIKKLSPGFNSLVGSLTYSLSFGLLFIITYFIIGTRVLDEIWFIIFGAISFPLTGWFLRKIGFWFC